MNLPHLPDHQLHVCLFKDVKNAAFLRQQLLNGNTDFEYAFLDASVLLSRNHVLAACFRAIVDQLNGRLKSRNVHSEIVFALSPNNNVSGCIKAERSAWTQLFSLSRIAIVLTAAMAHNVIISRMSDISTDRRILPALWHIR